MKQATKDRLVGADCLIQSEQDTQHKEKDADVNNMTIQKSWESKTREENEEATRKLLPPSYEVRDQEILLNLIEQKRGN